jgi:hypothetical protein
MQPLGFSTGALALSDFREALRMLRDQPVSVIELSAIREHELVPLLYSLDDLDLSQFSYVSIHAPSSFSPGAEIESFQALNAIRDHKWPFVIHPDTLHDFSLWRMLGDLVCVENMDKRKSAGRTVRELEAVFNELPQASFCFDIGHARQVDTSMTEAYRMLKRFSSRLRQVHISEVNTLNKHDRLSFVSILGFQEVAQLIPSSTPVIIESVINEDQIGDELRRVRDALRPPVKQPRPTVEAS